MKAVKFPTPLRPFVTREVLVETYEVRVVALPGHTFHLPLAVGPSPAHRKASVWREDGICVCKTVRSWDVLASGGGSVVVR